MHSSTATFGPQGDQWIYNTATKTYDLTRGASSPNLTIKTTSGPPNTSISLSPSHTALVIIDMQNYFLHPSCRAHPPGLAAVEPTIALANYCRDAGIKVIWLNWGLTDADIDALPAGVQRGFSRSLIDDSATVPGAVPRTGLGADLGGEMGRCLMAGSWNADIYEPLKAAAVREGDVHVAKNRMSGLWNSEQPLAKYLGTAEGKKVRTLMFAGVNTDQCVLGTLADAYNSGWDCVMVEDCCATLTPQGREVCLYNIGNSYGFIVDSKAILASQSK